MSANSTFVPYSTIGSEKQRRTRPRIACETCRNRKRRCVHSAPEQTRSVSATNMSPQALTEDQSDTEISDTVLVQGPENHGTQLCQVGVVAENGSVGLHAIQSGNDGELPQSSETSVAHTGAIRSRPRAKRRASTVRTCASSMTTLKTPVEPSPSTSRFVGDLNPEARLLEQSYSPAETQHVASDKVGLWVSTDSCKKCLSAQACSRDAPIRAVLANQLPMSASDLLPTDVIVRLSDLYFEKIHPLIPILNETEYRQSLASGKLPAVLAHTVCLLAAKNETARDHLKLLQTGDAIVSTRQYCSRLYTSIRLSLAAISGLPKLTIIRIMALLSFHHEGCDGAEEASGFIAQAVHRAQSLALHLRVPNDDDFEMRRLFWCLWVMDRLNAAMHSRPCLIADHDVAAEVIPPRQSGFPAFDILLEIAQILSRVIALYRPSTPESVTGVDDFPSFHHMVTEGDGWHLRPSTLGRSTIRPGPVETVSLDRAPVNALSLATLRMFYLTTAILGHRLRSITALPTATRARLKQQLSAMQIIRHISDPGCLHALHPFPIVVYATSLSLSVMYQQLRFSRLSTDQEEARHDFNAASQVLQILRNKWESADVVAFLAHRISTELDGVVDFGRFRFGNARMDVDNPQPIRRRRQEAELVRTPDNLGNTDGVSSTTQAEDGWRDVAELDIFSGMDDLSWMYLDAEYPFSSDMLPTQNV